MDVRIAKHGKHPFGWNAGHEARQPLSRLIVAAPDAKAREAIERHRVYIQEETLALDMDVRDKSMIGALALGTIARIRLAGQEVELAICSKGE